MRTGAEDVQERDDVPRASFSLAIDNGWATIDPVSRAARPKRRRHRDADPDIQFLTLDELEAVISSIPSDVVSREPTRQTRRGAATAERRLGPVMRVLILTAASAGLRRSELLGLRWRDLDWRSRRLRVRNP